MIFKGLSQPKSLVLKQASMLTSPAHSNVGSGWLLQPFCQGLSYRALHADFAGGLVDPETLWVLYGYMRNEHSHAARCGTDGGASRE